MNNISEYWHRKAKWIGTGPSFGGWTGKVLPAPFFRKVFTLDRTSESACLKICGLGYYEVYLNGKKVGDHVLDPVVTHYDKRALYVTYDVGDYLVEGTNVIGVVLGNGWYNCHTPEVWHFDKAPWRAYPKFLLQMDIDDECILASDQSWTFSSGPIIFDGLRNGETYDARLELTDWLEIDYDESEWTPAARVAPPGGVLEEQTMPPCKVMKTLETAKQWDVPEGIVFDIGQVMAGWARISVRGDRGTKITLTYAERLDENGCADQSKLSHHVLVESGEFQTDRYILKGDVLEVWEPRFSYHGFRYVQATIEGNATIEKLEGRVVHTAFEKIGTFECSDEIINKLQHCTEWSYIGNFVGIPTDCPQREKNGWTGDAQLAAETGLFNYDAASSYAQWIDSIVDVQRPSGQLPGIVPSVGWGYNWGSGPAWDSVLLLIPWYAYLYTGDDAIIRKHYDAMKKYVDYCTYMAGDHIVKFGLGDWGHPERLKNPDRLVDNAITDTSYYYTDSMLLAKFAELTGRDGDRNYYSELAKEIKTSFNHNFYRGEGIYARGEQTAMGCALYQGLVEDSEKKLVVNALVKSIENLDFKPDFGILGAKYVPRALAENGQAELAYKLMTQSKHPGWVFWLQHGATTLWESWRTEASSLNHIMFGDISAWFYQYLAGITPDENNPGFKHFFIRPQAISKLSWAKADYHCPYGKISSSWQIEGGDFSLKVEVPHGCNATVILPDSQQHNIESGTHCFTSSQ